MKKSVLLSTLFIITLLLLPSILAVDISFSKDSYQPQETLQAIITGNFLSLTSENVFIYQNGKVHPEPIIKGLTKQNNIYYFYAVLPNQPGNYTFTIQDTGYLERGEIKTDPIEIGFEFIFKDVSDLSINPGFVVPDQNEFSIKVKSLFGSTDLTATFEATQEIKTLSLIEQREETLSFSFPSNIPPQKSKVTINNYEIPVFLTRKTDGIIIQFPELEFIPFKLDGILTTGNYFFRILLKNMGDKNLTDIALSSDLNAILQPDTIDLLEPDQSKLINLTILIPETDQDQLSGQIIAEVLDKQYSLLVLFNLTQDETQIDVSDTIPIPLDGELSCSRLGNLCNENQICSADIVESLEGPCCVGSCTKEKKSNIKLIAGIILSIILILAIIYFYFKLRKRKKLKSPEDILKEKGDKFKERMEGKPGKPSEEVNKKLEKV